MSSARTAEKEMGDKHKEEEAKSVMLQSERDHLAKQLAEAKLALGFFVFFCFFGSIIG